MEMEGLSAGAQWTPLNEKSCQTDDLCHEATVPGPDQASKTPVYSVEPGDPPLLQRPLETSKSGIQQIIECFRSGTTQLKHILLKEVDTIFECKLCRSLFRGLPNLITHKEYYCFPRLPEPGEHLGDGKQSLAIKELLEAIYPRPDRQDYVVRLEPIEGNQNAVFQHLIKEDDLESPFPCDSSNHSMDSWRHPQLESHGEEQEHGTGGESDQGDGEAEQSEEGGEKLAKQPVEGVTLQENKEKEEDCREGVDEQVVNSGVDDVTITCCLCGKDFCSRRGIRRHCHKMHKRRLEELRKFTDTRTVPISLFSVVKDRQTGQVHTSSPNGKCCPVCFKTFATKANVCRHFDEVHRGLRRDLITPDIATKPGQLEATPPPHVPISTTPKALLPLPQYNLATCKCLLCKRTYSTQARLRRHMRFVHKILASKSPSTDLSDAKSIASECLDASPCPSNNLEPADHERLKRPREEDEDGPLSCKPRLSMGFDFRQLFCKLCKRQFSSRQNLSKHIELHTDNGSDIFIKFYRCPLCPYESRRKRDVLRHITVVHKKNSAYLAKILPSLEMRAVKKPAEVVLGGSEKHSHAKEEVDEHKPASSRGPPRAECFPPSALVSAKQDLPPPSPPVTRKQSLLPRIQNSVFANSEEVEDSTEVRVTKNFSLHACDMCGRAFAKKVYLESHKRSHRNVANIDGRTTGVNTRSKSLLGSF